jgi:hypothetical protein
MLLLVFLVFIFWTLSFFPKPKKKEKELTKEEKLIKAIKDYLS